MYLIILIILDWVISEVRLEKQLLRSVDPNAGNSRVAVSNAEVSKLVSKQVSKCFSMAPHTRSHRAPCSCFPRKVSLQLSSKESVGDVGITQLEWKRVPQARCRGCKCSVAITAECSRHHASRHVSWPQRAPSAVGHETAVVGQVERRLPGQRLANQACHFVLDALSDGQPMEFA